jgi:hypothetical protein
MLAHIDTLPTPWEPAAVRADLLLGINAAIALSGCPDPCGNHAFQEFRSPSGMRKLVVFERSCGATTGFSTQVSLLPGDAEMPKGPGNLLSIDTDHGKVAADDNGKIAVKVTFEGDSIITLAYPARARVFASVAAKDGALIRHERIAEQLPPPPNLPDNP